jgi:hypothetical protein
MHVGHVLMDMVMMGRAFKVYVDEACTRLTSNPRPGDKSSLCANAWRCCLHGHATINIACAPFLLLVRAHDL